MNKKFWFLGILCSLIIVTSPLFAQEQKLEQESAKMEEKKEKISFEGTATLVYQWMDGSKIDSKNRGSGAVDLGLTIRPIENGKFFILGSFASGNGLKDVSPFILTPNADDLEDDVKNINGHEQQDNILELWYEHTFNFGNDTAFKIRAGILDATYLIDDNRFADDEINQFMNEVFVDTPLFTPPSYDLGAMLELSKGSFTTRFVIMTTKYSEYEEDYEIKPFYYQYYALELAYNLKSSWGEGNYRIYGYTTSKDFPNWKKEPKKESIYGIGISLDQDLGFIKNPFGKNPIGFFMRAGWQNDDAIVNYRYLISGGFNIPFCFLGREGNEIGIGYAYLDSPDKADLSNTHALEAYAKFDLFSYERLSSNLTFDFQYLKDNYKNNEEDKEGYIIGFRWNLSF